ncbi:prenyltransferase/squalene oxidase repeat-containing protein [Streptomyces sp. 1331.2]|uniref:prenyltransferase/squalene oxidase repeat-containing protein n=1 Tax=Streptomyces sp. 1331.2 TaxID=1938835 RepID=UPI000BCE7D20|nr:prenyltransferase/squalene oxidase repeat-containing protein [Streptomyces sp. 1331.2]SOB84410.1 LPXTG-motif cell wall anchor domain-containing protein [Streptomyces sp. 1331.2]
MLTAARLGAAALSAALLTGIAAGPALADVSPPAVPDGLYGKSDPTYDGVWRQALALTALTAAKVTPADSAVGWLTGQQCEDGGWPSYRAAGAGCDPKSEDSNATAVAVQALIALGGHQPAVDKGVAWLKANQNADGSWAYNPGNPGDANSTGLAVSALFAARTDPASVAKAGSGGAAGKNAFDGLARFQLGCAAPADQRGAFAYQPDAATGALAPNTLASAQAALAAAGGHLPVAGSVRADTEPKPLACADGSAPATVPHAEAGEAVGAYLSAQLTGGGDHLTLTTPGAAPSPDYTATAWAALALSQSGHHDQAAGAVDWLDQQEAAWTKDGSDAGATATLLLVSEAAHRDTAELTGKLTALGPTPKATTTSDHATPAKKKTDSISQYWLIGVGLLIGIGGGLLLSLQRKRNPKL